MNASFLDATHLLAGGHRRFERQIERLLFLLGFEDVRNIDGSGDRGGDILAVRRGERFVFQSKFTSSQTISKEGVDEVDRAKAFYRCDRAVVVTNARPSSAATRRAQSLAQVGDRIDIWDGPTIRALYDAAPLRGTSSVKLRRYQTRAVISATEALDRSGRALMVMATGLGKTMVAGELIREHLERTPGAQVLVVAHMKELVSQLERALWVHLPKNVSTHMLTGDDEPPSLDGVICSTMESAWRVAQSGYRPTFVFLDETHHLGQKGTLHDLLGVLADSKQLGATATPWRGDQFDISTHFGPACFRMSIADGMAEGWLAQVDYQIFSDNIDWDFVKQASEHSYSLRDLNAHLFLPQRDEQIIRDLEEVWLRTPSPRALVFCRTIEHAERMAQQLSRSSPHWRRATSATTRRSRRERDLLMLQFRQGLIPMVTAVDIFNEGVDVPDVNILCFLRVTHSRRIFVQQLGRGLRLKDDNSRVSVLDYVSDIRRVAATLDLQRSLAQLSGVDETLVVQGATFTFSNDTFGSLMDEWIQDAASLESTLDESQLQFPLVPGSAT